MGALEEYLEELKLQQQQREGQTTSALEDLLRQQQEDQDEIAVQSQIGAYNLDLDDIDKLTPEQAAEVMKETPAKTAKLYALRSRQDASLEERAIRADAAEKAYQYQDQIRKIASLRNMRFDDPQFNSLIPEDPGLRNNIVMDPKTRAVSLQPKAGQSEKQNRIIEMAQSLNIPQSVIANKLREDTLVALTAREKAESLAYAAESQAHTREGWAKAKEQEGQVEVNRRIDLANKVRLIPDLLEAWKGPTATQEQREAVMLAEAMNRGTADRTTSKSRGGLITSNVKSSLALVRAAIDNGEDSIFGKDISGLEPGQTIPDDVVAHVTKMSQHMADTILINQGDPREQGRQVSQNPVDDIVWKSADETRQTVENMRPSASSAAAALQNVKPLGQGETTSLGTPALQGLVAGAYESEFPDRTETRQGLTRAQAYQTTPPPTARTYTPLESLIEGAAESENPTVARPNLARAQAYQTTPRPQPLAPVQQAARPQSYIEAYLEAARKAEEERMYEESLRARRTRQGR